MPSFNHDGLVRLFADRPELAVGLLRDVLGIGIPEYTEARRDNLDLTDLEPASRYADLVVLASGEAVVLAVVVEIQLEINADKRFSWPAYLANLRAKLRCPVELLVVTPSDRVARWAAEPIPIGQGYIRPVVLGPRGMPVVTDHDAARESPELAVLSATAHGHGPVDQAVAVALAALAAVAEFPDERALLYSDIIMASFHHCVSWATPPAPPWRN